MKLKINRMLAGLLACLIVLSGIPMIVTVSAEEESGITIGTLAELQAFADAVNSGTSYEGVTVTLTANISLGGESNPWTPIGTSSAFKGTLTATIM